MKKKRKKQTKKIKKEQNSIDRYLSLIGTRNEQDYFLENLAVLSGAGITIVSAIESIVKETRSKGMRVLLTSLKEDVESGMPLWKAIEKTKMVNDSSISLIKLGEENGQLSQNLNIIILRQRRDRAFHSKIRSAMLYPVFVLTLAFIIGIGISWFMLPRLAKVFAGLKLDLPLITRILIAFGKFIESYGAVVIPLVVVFSILTMFFVFFYSKTKFIGEWMLFSFPGVRRIIQSIELSRFGFIMGTLLKAGLPMINAVHALNDSAGFGVYHKMYRQLEKNIEEGNSFQKSFLSYQKMNKLIPPPQQHMIVAAEQSGKLEETFLQIGEIYEEKTETATKNMAVLLEPVLLVIVWLAVVFVALAVILPIYSLVGGLNSNNGRDVTASPEAAPQVVQEHIENQIENQENPQETQKASETEDLSKQMVKILPTETGTLNVRQAPSIKAKKITNILPGESYTLKGEENNWYNILLSGDQEGWIIKKYAEIIEENGT